MDSNIIQAINLMTFNNSEEQIIENYLHLNEKKGNLENVILIMTKTNF